MTPFMDWLRVELLRLRSFDWREGMWTTHWLKDGVAKFNSHYNIKRLADRLGVSEDDILKALDSPPVMAEIEGKAFTASWLGDSFTLNWIEEAIRDTKTEFTQRYSEEDGKFYTEHRWVEKIVYLDGTERVVKDSGTPKRVEIPEAEFTEAMKRIREMQAGPSHDKP